MVRFSPISAIAFLLSPAFLFACSYCESSSARKKSLREEAKEADCVLLGHMENPRMLSRDEAATDFIVNSFLRTTDGLAIPEKLTLPRYVPSDINPRSKKGPTEFLLFCKVKGTSFDAYRGQEADQIVAEYLDRALKLPKANRIAEIVYFADHLDSKQELIAADAFLELAKTSDAEMRLAGNALLPAERLRKLIEAPQTPPERLSLFCYMLGRAGRPENFAFLKNLLQTQPERFRMATAGALGGLIEISPAEGWKYLRARAFRKENNHADQLAVLNALRFFRAARPADLKTEILPIMRDLFDRGDFADLVVEDWRQWKVTDYSAAVVAKYGAPTHSAPLIKRAIIRYALTTRDEACAQFLAGVRMSEAELVDEIQGAIRN